MHCWEDPNYCSNGSREGKNSHHSWCPWFYSTRLKSYFRWWIWTGLCFGIFFHCFSWWNWAGCWIVYRIFLFWSLKFGYFALPGLWNSALWSQTYPLRVSRGSQHLLYNAGRDLGHFSGLNSPAGLELLNLEYFQHSGYSSRSKWRPHSQLWGSRACPALRRHPRRWRFSQGGSTPIQKPNSFFSYSRNACGASWTFY